ncbi:MAG: MgtC/SapB family protein [Burkholderiaceae bacterium]|nr:MAG: MgtC/SapB family protein [Burkholderiaceae bacterium]
MDSVLYPGTLNEVLNLVLALVLGAAIGAERQFRMHPAGLHTNSLVSLGSAAFVMVSVLTHQQADMTRVAAQVVSGVGFLCAGVIWHEGVTVRGLNTAATVWCSAAVGVLAGLGFRSMAVIMALTVLAANIVLHYLERITSFSKWHE